MRVFVAGYKRLPHDVKILALHEFKCTFCGNADTKLRIHTREGKRIQEHYRKTASPNLFDVMCQECYSIRTQNRFNTYRRNQQIAELSAVYKIKEIGQRLKISPQRVQQILTKAERENKINLREVILARKRAGIKIADLYNKTKFNTV